MKNQHVFGAFFNTPWFLAEGKAQEILAFLELRAAGLKVSADEIERLVAASDRGATSAPASLAVLPLLGVINQRMNLMTAMSGGTSTQMFSKSFREVLNDPSVKAIIIDCDSPGGSVYGIDELAAEIRNARGGKPIVAVANSLMASAAYYICSAADEIIVTPGGEAGSIGVLAMHLDYSAQNDMLGVKPTLIKAGKYKAEGSPEFPLSEEATGHIQEDVNRYYGMFLAAVAAGRGVSASDVRDGFGEGRVVGAQEAVRLGMADRVATLEQTIQRFASGGRVSRSRGAMARLTEQAIDALIAADEALDRMAGPIPPHKSSAIAPEDATWDANAEVAKANGATELRRMHAWVDSSGDPEAKSSYKLPHHRADGTLVPKGLYAAAGRLDQTDIPAGDKAGTREHLDQHYDELGKDPPWPDSDASAAAARDADELAMTIDLIEVGAI